MSLPVGAYKRAKLVGGLLIAGGMYGAELTNAPGYLRNKKKYDPPSQEQSAGRRRVPGDVSRE
eukprot:5873657-Heterocapsa_arctica.AAC.1